MGLYSTSHHHRFLSSAIFSNSGRFCASVLLGVVLLLQGRSLQCTAHQDPTPSANALLPSAGKILPTTQATPTVAPPMEKFLQLGLQHFNLTEHPCTCGVFMTNQFKRGCSDQPTGAPAFRHEQGKVFPCNQFGTKQCQNKCLEVFVKHLPSAGSILCATMNRDCHKEKAYLFVQNCNNKWVNTNLSTGREICCKDGVSYQCPII